MGLSYEGIVGEALASSFYFNVFVVILISCMILDFLNLLPIKNVVRQVWIMFPVLFSGASVHGKELIHCKHVYKSRVWPGDLDIWCHKNNIEYVVRCEIGRMALFRNNGLLHYCRNNKIHAGFSAISLRFRRELSLFQPFTVESKICGWDDRSWYIEQKFISKGGFVHCHSLSVLKLGKRGNAGKTTPAKILRELAKVKVDDLDDINMNEGLKLLSAVYDTSSKELRKEK